MYLNKTNTLSLKSLDSLDSFTKFDCQYRRYLVNPEHVGGHSLVPRAQYGTSRGTCVTTTTATTTTQKEKRQKNEVLSP
jgi:hypothetical protein